jgi:hypothetical protein
MSPVAIHGITEGGFKAEALSDGNRLTLILSGSADASAAPHLQLMIHHIRLQARRQPTEAVVVDFRRLEFMVSSCFKCLLTWINEVRDADTAAQYRIRFVSDGKYRWQLQSLRSLQAFSRGLVSIESEP